MRTIAAAVLVAALVGPAAAGDLGIGSPAPKLAVKEFVKGEAVTEIAKGKVHVIEFWATWCGPCRTSIPHVSDLQKKYKDAVFIGVSVWEQDQDKVKPFVEEMGDKMGYRVATDDGDKMAETWMKAADQNGIPAAFIVDAQGTVAWIGHPMSMDKPLDKIVSGKWDVKAAAAEFKKAKEMRAKMTAVMPKLRKAGSDPEKLLKAIDEAIADDADLEDALGMTKFNVLVKIGDAGKTAAYADKLIGGPLKENAQGLNAIAWGLVEKPGEKPDAKLMAVALKAAKRADELVESKDAAIADTLAKAQFEAGDPKAALATQERAVKLAKGTPLEKDEDMKERLETYKKAAAEKK